MDESEYQEHQDEDVTEKRVWSLNNFFASVLVFLVIVIVFFIITISLNLDLLFLTMIACFFIVIYSIVLFFLLEPRVVREVRQTTTKTIERPIERQIENQVVVEKPVQVVHEVEKRIYILPEKKEDQEPEQEEDQEQEKTPNSYYTKERNSRPKYSYIGSSQTKTYHKRSCRMSKLIKGKYKVLNNSSSYFIKNKFKPCEICILKTKKV